MSIRKVLAVGLISFTFNAIASQQSYYCPQNHKYINLGMSTDQVGDACGVPISKQETNRPVMQKVPVQELTFNAIGAQKVFYGVYAIPTGTDSGAKLQVNIVDNKVKSIVINGSGTNAFSICGGISIQAGDPASKVYGACGNPSVVNNSFINQPLLSNAKTQVWIYQPTDYQPPITLTFVNGKLQSID
ncbi:MAG: DUF2845 domain-containing protein [Tatlockia sp.]|nr:DUF2845 domain-containing protein [Tatlockia sp.]